VEIQLVAQLDFGQKMAASETLDPELTALKKRREEKEIDKLELEVADLKRPLWQRPSNLIGVMTALAAIGGLIIQNQLAQHTITNIQEDAELNLSAAQAQTATAEAELSSLTEQTIGLRNEADTLQSEITALNQQKERSIAEYKIVTEDLERVLAQLDEAEASGEPLAPDTIGTIRQSISETYKGFECGQGTKFHCP